MKMLSYFVILNCHFEKRGGLKKSRVPIQSDRASGFSCEDPVRGTCFFCSFQPVGGTTLFVKETGHIRSKTLQYKRHPT
jgi:hypothetical protein